MIGNLWRGEFSSFETGELRTEQASVLPEQKLVLFEQVSVRSRQCEALA
jgi:hypothetical protein